MVIFALPIVRMFLLVSRSRVKPFLVMFLRCLGPGLPVCVSGGSSRMPYYDCVFCVVAI